MILEAINFFRDNGCEIEIFHFPDRYFIWSKIDRVYLIQDANEYQVINLYKKFKP
jgi:hypothetical protein